MKPTRIMAACLAAMVVLSGCGGDGVDDSSLMPEAPALGAVLHEEATALRPLKPGSTWSYEVKSSASSTGRRIDVRQSPFGDGVSERIQPSNGGGAYVHLAHRKGDVVQFGECELFGVGTLCHEWAELRSPVQIGDQIELINLDNSSRDQTGDGVPDRFEYAVYRRVIGEELVNLPAQGDVRAVRVDTVVRQRLTDGRGEAPQRQFEAVWATWYAPGIGIVRRRAEISQPMFGSPRTDDWRLVAWYVESANAPSASTKPQP